MADILYKAGTRAVMQGDIDLENDDIRAVLVDADYTPTEDDNALDDVPSGARLATATLAGKAVTTDNAFDCDDTTFTAPASPNVAVGVVFYKHNATESLAALICYRDTIEGFPFTCNDANLTIEWSDGINRVFRYRQRIAA